MNWFEHKRHEDCNDHELLLHIAKSLDEIVSVFVPQLTSIQIVFTTPTPEDIMATNPTPPAPAAVTLAVGQLSIASIVGFDQNGNPFTGTIPAPTWAVDNPQFASIEADGVNPQNEDVTGVAPGTANLSAAVAGPNGTLTATGVVTVVPATASPVLTSIGIQFSAPTTPEAVASALAAKRAATKLP